MTSTLETLTAQMIPAVEEEMRHVLRARRPEFAAFYGMMHYHMGWVNEAFEPEENSGGKRIRPVLCLLTTAACGTPWTEAVPAGAALEILHNFTLVHDDIQDVSPTRRGRETVWKIWGSAQAINAGDAMFAASHLAMARLADRGVPAERVVHALRRLDQMCMDLTIGQHLDMGFETRSEVAVEEYVDMITGKTAALLSLSAELGPVIAGADAETVEHYERFGLELGLAFQVLDDILGIWGDEEVIGKSAATDIVTRKKTLPVLYGLAESAALRELYASEAEGDEFVAGAVALLDACGARSFAEEKAHHYSSSALEHLEAADPRGEAGRALRELAHMLLNREH